MGIVDQWMDYTRNRWSLNSFHKAKRGLTRIDKFLSHTIGDSGKDIVEAFGISEARTVVDTVVDIDDKFLTPLGISKYLNPADESDNKTVFNPAAGGDIGRDAPAAAAEHTPSAPLEHTEQHNPVYIGLPGFPSGGVLTR